MGIDPEFLRCLESQSHLFWVGTRRDFKIVFQSSLVPVINKVNSRVNVLIPHARKLRNIAMPFGGIVSDEVIALAGKLFVTRSGRVLIGSVQRHTNDGSFPCGIAHRQHGAISRQKQSMAGPMRQKLHLRRGLALVRLENQRQTHKRSLRRYCSHMVCGRSQERGKGTAYSGVGESRIKAHPNSHDSKGQQQHKR